MTGGWEEWPLGKSAADRKGSCFVAAGDTELGKDVGCVGGDGTAADEKGVRDFVVGSPFDQQPKDLELTYGEAQRARRSCALVGSSVVARFQHGAHFGQKLLRSQTSALLAKLVESFAFQMRSQHILAPLQHRPVTRIDDGADALPQRFGC